MNTKIKAVILAAGRGIRLYPLTVSEPKCLVKVGGKSLIDWQVEAIRKIGIEDIVVVVGHQKEVIKKHFGNQVRYREFADYERTNNLHTLWSVRDELECTFMCFFSDLIFEVNVIEDLKRTTDDVSLVVDTGKVLEGTMRVKISRGRLVGIGDHIDTKEGSGNFIGIAQFSSAGSKMLVKQMGKMVPVPDHKKDYYTAALNFLLSKGQEIGYVDVKNKIWAEIDTIQDLNFVEQHIIPKLGGVHDRVPNP